MNATTNRTARSAKAPQTIEVDTIRERDHQHFGRKVEGRTAEGHRATILPGKSITLHGRESCRGERPALYANDFEIGSPALRGAFNIDYVGIITAITEKTVTITDHGRAYRLSLFRFDQLNWDFDAEKSAERNANWMD